MINSDAYIYLNNAATSYPKAPPVAEAVRQALLDMPGAANRGGIESFNVFDAVRAELAALLGVSDPARIALGANATWGLNLALFGFPFNTGDVVLSTKAEHNSVLRPLYALEQRGIAKTIYLDVDPDGRLDPDTLASAVARYQPRLVAFTHASNVTGAVGDAETLCRIAKEGGAAVLIDASQTLGLIPLGAGAWGADLVAFTGHKYLLGPQGTGGLYVAPGTALTPWLVGGTGIHSDRDTMPDEMPVHLEAGTGNEPSYHGLLAALRWAKSHPRDENADADRLRRLKSGLVAAGADVIDPKEPCTPVVSFTVKGYAPADVADILTASYDILCRTGLHCAPKIFPGIGAAGGTVRLSLSRFTTDAEIDAVLAAVRDIVDAL